ncbi:MAG: GDP-mannose 4,6-dehydratase, partial [Candidatus Andersenbacteria bacterium]|nr:GDP-mannose 4,6-dehydratase [Candidatus Andersenbacteria bacterium]
SLAQALVPLGAQVTILDAMLPLYGGNMFNLDGIEDEVEFHHGDIRDPDLVNTLVAGRDIIYNLAAQVSYIDSRDEPFLDLDINGKGHLTVLEAVRHHAPHARVLFSSSRMVYGKIMTVPVKESHPTDPLSLYGIHKILGEKYYRYYADTFGIHTTSVRIPNPYGPRQQMKHSKYSIVGWFVRQAFEDKTIQIFGDGSQERDYLYIDDIVSAFLTLTSHGSPGEVYNVGTHERVRFVDMVESVLSHVGSGKKEHVPWPKNYEKNETGNYIADTAKLFAATQWQPQVLLNDGIGRMVAYYRQHKSHYW